MGAAVQLYGAAYSVYVRAVRLALEEKGVAYELLPVDIFAEEGPPQDYARRQPFLKIPAFQHGDFQLYETDAILRYIAAAFPGPALQPALLRSNARAIQMLSILNAYAYRAGSGRSTSCGSPSPPREALATRPGSPLRYLWRPPAWMRCRT
jgi:glutathione S-transferase